MKNQKEQTLVKDSDLEYIKLEPGVKRKIMTYTDELMLTKVQFDKGSVGVLHKHLHLQVGYISKGVFEVTVGNKKQILSAGDVFYAPSMEEHGVVCLEDGEIIDVFNPMRNDFL